MYRRDDIKADAESKGWKLSELFRRAKVNRWTGYDFMDGTTNSPNVAARLTKALHKPEGFYQVRRERVAS